MSYRTIAVHLDAGPRCATRVDLAARVAARHGSRLVGVDLLVCGGYGHSRLRDWTLGGVTRHLLAHLTVPTLLSH